MPWERALDDAEKFTNELYPAYIKLFDRVQATPSNEVKVEDRRKLFEMHYRLEQMKKDIQLAAA